MPYQIGRFAHGHRVRPEPKRETQTSPRDLLRRFYFDALTHDAQAARHLITMVGADRVVIGSDHPFDMGDPHPVATVRAAGLGTAERDVLGENALRLLEVKGVRT